MCNSREPQQQHHGGCRWMGREAVDDPWVKSLPVTYALLSGTIGTQSVLFCKTLSTLLRTTLAGDSQLHSVFFWVTFLAFVATAYFWISRLNLVRVRTEEIPTLLAAANACAVAEHSCVCSPAGAAAVPSHHDCAHDANQLDAVLYPERRHLLPGVQHHGRHPHPGLQPGRGRESFSHYCTCVAGTCCRFPC